MATSTTTTIFADLATRYAAAYAALNAAEEDDEIERQSAAFDEIRDAVFAFRPATMAEVAEKAAFLAKRYDDADGMSARRIAQLFESLAA